MSESERRSFARRTITDVVSPELRSDIAALVEDVRVRGDEAVCDATRRFDGVSLRTDQLRVDADDIMRATVSADVQRALEDSIDHVRDRKSTRLNSSHSQQSRMPSSA